MRNKWLSTFLKGCNWLELWFHELRIQSTVKPVKRCLSLYKHTHFTQTHIFFISILLSWRMFNLQTPNCHTRTESLLNTQCNQMHDANLPSFHVMKKWSCWLVPCQSLIICLSPQEPVEGGWGAHKQNTMVKWRRFSKCRSKLQEFRQSSANAMARTCFRPASSRVQWLRF